MNNMKNLGKDIKTVLITKEQIEKRVEELGRQITKDYERKRCGACWHSERCHAFPL